MTPLRISVQDADPLDGIWLIDDAGPVRLDEFLRVNDESLDRETIDRLIDAPVGGEVVVGGGAGAMFTLRRVS